MADARGIRREELMDHAGPATTRPAPARSAPVAGQRLHRPWLRARHRAGIAAFAVAALAAACTGSPTTNGAAGTASPGATGAAAPGPPCTPPTTTTPVRAEPVPGVATDWSITSFDGTVIRAHWFPLPDAGADHPAPTVLMGPGWGLPGDTNVDAVGVLGALNIGTLRNAGYNVLTWDPRGFGESQGVAEVDTADAEGRDVQQLLDWVATQPGVQLDGTRDPRVGMVGGSYGGGIQLVTAPTDCRIDALVPVIAWHSLTTSLYKADTFKQGWAELLNAVTRSHPVDPHVISANMQATTTGVLSPDTVAWFEARGPGDAVGRITVPTLLIQGTVDTLFTLDEADVNSRILQGNHVPTAMVWFCGGHGVCLTNPGDLSEVPDAAVRWLDRYVKRDSSVSTGPAFSFVDQDGATWTDTVYPPASAGTIEGHGSGTLEMAILGGSGPAIAPSGTGDLLASSVSPITPSRASNAVDVRVTNDGPTASIVGAPSVSLTYSGTTPPGPQPTRVFAQLVDDTTGIVVGNQATPIPVVLDGQQHRTTVPLEQVAFTARPGAHVTLQLVASTVSYAPPRLGGTVTFDAVDVTLPVVSGLSGPEAPPATSR
jgi:ABC-2 type transport system ATP-binding protein